MTTTLKSGVSTYTTPTDRQVVITRVFDAPRKLVFEAWTDPKHLPNWLTGPDGWSMPICELDARPGGKWRYVYRKSGGTEMTISGTVREIIPFERFVTTERWGPEWPESENRLDFTELNGQTTVTLTITYESKKIRDAALDTGMRSGVEDSFARLDRWLTQATRPSSASAPR